MNPLVIKSGIRKLLDTLRGNHEPVCKSDLLAHQLLERIHGIQYAFGHRQFLLYLPNMLNSWLPTPAVYSPFPTNTSCAALFLGSSRFLSSATHPGILLNASTCNEPIVRGRIPEVHSQSPALPV